MFSWIPLFSLWVRLCLMQWIKLDHRIGQTEISIPAQPLTSCVKLTAFLHLSRNTECWTLSETCFYAYFCESCALPLLLRLRPYSEAWVFWGSFPSTDLFSDHWFFSLHWLRQLNSARTYCWGPGGLNYTCCLASLPHPPPFLVLSNNSEIKRCHFQNGENEGAKPMCDMQMSFPNNTKKQDQKQSKMYTPSKTDT